MCTCARLPKIISHHLPSQQYHYFQQYHDLILLFTVLPPFNVQTKQPINFPTIFEFIPLSLPPPPRILYFESYIYIYIYSPNTLQCPSSSLRNKNPKKNTSTCKQSYLTCTSSPPPPPLLEYETWPVTWTMIVTSLMYEWTNVDEG